MKSGTYLFITILASLCTAIVILVSIIPPVTIVTSSSYNFKTGTSLASVAFGIAGCKDSWPGRKGYISSWWRSESMRGAVWLDKMLPGTDQNVSSTFPPLIVSENTTRFIKQLHDKYKDQQPRVCRIPVEMFRNKNFSDVHWFVLGDDDTVFIPENIVKVLSKYDHNQLYYIGSFSENHWQNTGGCCTSNMAYGGAGYALSYPLVKALNGFMDECMETSAPLHLADLCLHTCITELGVPLTREPGFHQFDIHGDASGLLGTHPVAPLLTLHHIDSIDPLFPHMTREAAVHHLLQAASVDSSGLLQKSICYDRQLNWSIEVSWGWAVQITRSLLHPSVLNNPLVTFGSWSRSDSYMFKTRPLPKDKCQQPVRFFMHILEPREDKTSVSTYKRGDTNNGCSQNDTLTKLESVTVKKEVLPCYTGPSYTVLQDGEI